MYVVTFGNIAFLFLKAEYFGLNIKSDVGAFYTQKTQATLTPGKLSQVPP